MTIKNQGYLCDQQPKEERLRKCNDIIIIGAKISDTVDAREPKLMDGTSMTFNPYPILGAPTNDTWPRGLPLTEILKPENWNASLPQSTKVPVTYFGVLQSLADIQPDVDAIYRMTHPTPFLFKRTEPRKPL